MKLKPFSFQNEGVSELAAAASYWTSTSTINIKQLQREAPREPCSVLDNNRSPSPPTSSSTSLAGGGSVGASSDSAGVAALSGSNPTSTTNKWPQQPNSTDKKEEWASAAAAAGGGALDDWEAMLSAESPTQEQTFLHWIMGDIDDSKAPPPPTSDFEPFESLLDPSTAAFTTTSVSAPPTSLPLVPNSLSMLFFQEEEKRNQIVFSQNHQQQQSQSFFILPPPPPPLDTAQFVQPPNPKRHCPSNSGVIFRPPPKPKDEMAAVAIAQQQQGLVDQLFRSAELVESGNPFSAREILARLNHIIPASPIGLNPLLRSAFLFRDLLTNALANSASNTATTTLSNPWDVVLKLSSYKAFSEVSPLIHFTNFTCTQTLLEEIGAADRVHIIDFDIGIGGQWSSFMEELAHRRPVSCPFLKITAFVSPSSFHPLELHLTRENLSHFAAELNIPFEFNFLSIESFNPTEILALSANEAIAVNLPVGSHYAHSFPTLLRMVKQLSPKIVVSVDQGFNRSDLPFSHHFLHSFQSCMVLLDSIDAAGTNADVANKIERFLVQPRAESAVMGRQRITDKLPPWRALFTSVGFVPSQFSNFTETQAECLLKRVQVRGFHVEKRQASLFLYWQRGELGSVSAWRC